ncbi:unnamed protein product [Acanthoscelides obtectus]|uniref:Uncharacterized protein n=1 Tax=Acanthoscelides obtectus TaxID=200917 RepID=A0A9P0KLX8_ACAOB|nr:unnamed protein product [Acanthoscelides obtectus]CAK1635581.1 hypothetical protein AOBTE_LOCUS9368 [Acanthoscelides obtectus]
MDVFKAGPPGVTIITRKQFYDIMQGYTNNDINKNWTMLNLFFLNSQNYSEEQRKTKRSYT